MLCHASGFEDIDYWVQLTGLNKQKTGPNSGGITFLTIVQEYLLLQHFNI